MANGAGLEAGPEPSAPEPRRLQEEATWITLFLFHFFFLSFFLTPPLFCFLNRALITFTVLVNRSERRTGHGRLRLSGLTCSSLSQGPLLCLPVLCSLLRPGLEEKAVSSLCSLSKCWSSTPSASPPSLPFLPFEFAPRTLVHRTLCLARALSLSRSRSRSRSRLLALALSRVWRVRMTPPVARIGDWPVSYFS